MKDIDKQIDSFVKPVTDALESFIFFKIEVLGAQVPLVVIWLVVAALFFTIYFRFINIRAFKVALRLVFGKSDKKFSGSGEVTHFQALATALSATVGIGNIGGVAIAIGMGGPGAVFWLLVAGFLAMSTKFVECLLAVKFRKVNASGTISGGPMYYLEHGLAQVGWSKGFSKYLAKFYALGIVVGSLGMGNMFQSNQAFVQFVGITGGEASWFSDQGWLFGLILAFAIGAIIIGGLKSIVKFTEKVVPFMAVFYVVMCLVILSLNYEAIPWAIKTIYTEAFQPESISGGFIGVLVIGFKRAIFSNEAGIGSAAIAHSAVKTEEPATEGIVALLEPFIDTIVVCTMTSLLIVTTLYYIPDLTKGNEGIAMTSIAFERAISWSPFGIMVAVMLFALSTAISWSYYGMKAFTYLLGESKIVETTFKVIFCAFFALGCAIKIKSVLDFSDALVYVICIPNLLGLYFLAPIAKKELNQYLEKIKVR